MPMTALVTFSCKDGRMTVNPSKLTAVLQTRKDYPDGTTLAHYNVDMLLDGGGWESIQFDSETERDEAFEMLTDEL